MSRASEVLEAALAELKRLGITQTRVAYGRKHVRVEFMHLGRYRRLIVSSSPSDINAPNVTRQRVRRILRQGD